MKKAVLVGLTILLILCACARNRQKLSPQGNLYLKSANVYYNQTDNEASLQKALGFYDKVLIDNPQYVVALKNSADLNLHFASQIEPKKAVDKDDKVVYENYSSADSSLQYFKIAYTKYDAVINVISSFADTVGVEKPIPLTDDEKAIRRDATRKKESCFVRMFKIGQILYDNENYALAINTMEYLNTLQPDRQEPLRLLIAIYQKQKNYAKFEFYVNKVLEANPEDVELMNIIAGFYYTNGRTYYENASGFDNNAKDLLLEADSLKYQRDFAKAYDDSLKTDAEYAKAKAERIKGDAEYAKAIPYYQKILVIRPDDVNNMLLLSDCYTYLKDYSAALGILAKILKIDGENKDALIAARDLSREIKNKTSEIAYMKSLIEVDPSSGNYRDYCFRIIALISSGDEPVSAYTELMPYAEKWYDKYPTDKNAVSTCVFIANKIGRKDLETKYTNIYRNMP